MKVNFKAQLKEMMVKDLGAKEKEEVYVMTEENFLQLDAEIGNGGFEGKFIIKKSKKDKALFAVAYISKKSENVVVIRVKEVKVIKVSSKKLVNALKLKTEMKKDTGINIHKASFEMKNTNDGNLLDKFIKLLNVEIETSGLGSEAQYENVDNTENGFSGYIDFPKIKGHSKDGYANYKKCMTEAKRKLRV